jgi:hypothetical protein
MSEDVQEDQPSLGETSEFAASGLPDETGSLLDALAAERDEMAAERETFIPIPGYGRDSGVIMLVKYRLLGGEEIAGIGRKVQREFRKSQQYERILYASIDTMIAACEGFYAQRGTNGEKLELPLYHYDTELAKALKFEDQIDPNQPARSVVIALFGGNMIAIQQHTLLLGRWMGDTTMDATAEFLDQGGNL